MLSAKQRTEAPVKKVAIVTLSGFSVTVGTVILFCWLIGINQHDLPKQYLTALAVAFIAHLAMSWNAVKDLQERGDA